MTGKTVLVAPLDWGLGHTTRCIPVIKLFLNKDFNVILAGEKHQEALLKKEFPGLLFLPLRGYNIKYGRSSATTLFKLLVQIPKILKTIKTENRWLKNVIEEYNIDAVISDNRYGLYSKKIQSIIITHQLQIKSPFGKMTEKLLQKRMYKWIEKFSACWVPDINAENSLAGELAHPCKLPGLPVKYIGPLSRFSRLHVHEEKNRLLIILSGPEPQRSLFENSIIDELVHYNGHAVVVRGLPGFGSIIPSTSTIQFYNHLPADELQSEIQRAEFVISRCGYSTVMDLITLKKKSILIPTPGQTEQEYLAEYLLAKSFAFTLTQRLFALKPALQQASHFNYIFPGTDENFLLEKTIEEL